MQGVLSMIIRVIYQDGQVGTVKPAELDDLISRCRIHSFRRSSGWVDISKGPLRENRSSTNAVPERRAEFAHRRATEDDTGANAAADG